MYRPAPRHPLSSFRFWFLVLGCVAATTAWRMGWLPHSRTEPVTQTSEVQLPTGTEPAPVPNAAALAEATTDPFVDAVATAQPELTIPGDPRAAIATAAAAPSQPAGGWPESNPFGPAHPEFVPANTFARQPEAVTPAGRQRFPADPGMIQQVAAVEADVPVNAAVMLQGETPQFPEPTPVPQVDWAGIDEMINAGQDVEAHRLLSSLYWEQPELRGKIQDRIAQTAQRIYFQPQPHYIDPHVVQGGDLLQAIAKDYNVSWQYLAKLNRTDPQRIRPNQNLKVIQGPFGAVVDLRRFELTVHAHGYFVAKFPIGIGKDGSTPVGEFTVEDKLENPTYYGPDGVVSANDPQNPLGEFWMSIGGGYGIHGTIDEASIGRAESRGCLRLKNQDVADLYDLLVVGSPVVIRR